MSVYLRMMRPAARFLRPVGCRLNTTETFQPAGAPHPLFAKPHKPAEQWDGCAIMPHPIYTQEEVTQVVQTHEKPKGLLDWSAYLVVRTMRTSFDIFSGYKIGPITDAKLLRRIIFLETVAGVPGMVGGAVRHLRSLRFMRSDKGWINSLVEEAENERYHMLTFITMANPGKVFRFAVLVTQIVFWNFFFLAYVTSPRWCHRFVGYLEEEAVKTYTSAIGHVDAGELPMFAKREPPALAKAYWRLPENSTLRDLLLHVRADEAIHRDVNHTFSRLNPNDNNPFILKQ